jgi:hypothetical protein
VVLKNFTVFCESDCLCVYVAKPTAAINTVSGVWGILQHWNELRSVLLDFGIEESRVGAAMRLFSCPFCETEKDNGKKTQKKKTRKDVDRHGELRAHGSDRVPAGDCSHVSQQHRSQKRRRNLAVFRALGAATWRRRRNSKVAAGHRSKFWSGGHHGESLF